MKKRSNRFISFIKNNWYFVLLIIPFVFFCIENRTPDNDIWFLLTNGRYVLNHGIPHIDPFSIHEGLHYVMQQWLSSVIFYGVYKLLGKYGLLILVTIVYALINFIYYKLCKVVTNDKKISLVITTIVMILSQGYIVTRPQIFTFLILLLELLCMEKYIRTNDGRKLVWMPLLSVLLINMHASMWLLQFVFMLPVLCNCIKIKGITVDKIRFKPLFITIVLMLLGGFINPYGYEAITFVFKTYGIPEINELVTEMAAANFSMFHWKLAVLLLLTIIGLITINKKVKLDIRDILFVCGSFLFASMHGKCIIYFIWYSGFILAKILSCYEDFAVVKDITKVFKKKLVINITRGLIIGLTGCLVFTFFFTSVELVKNYRMETNDVGDIVDYIVDHYDVDNVVLFIDFTEGGYSEFKGIKSYIDPRAEVFHDKLNKKENIIKEYLALYHNSLSYEYFLDKYEFTHLIVFHSKDFSEYLMNNDNYKNEYTTYMDMNKQVPYYELYVRNDVSINGDANDKDS